MFMYIVLHNGLVHYSNKTQKVPIFNCEGLLWYCTVMGIA